MTPQARIKARFAEEAAASGVRITVTARKGSDGTRYNLDVFGEWEGDRKFIQSSFPTAWMTSGGAGSRTYGVPRVPIERVLAETEFDPELLKWNGSTVRQIATGIRTDLAFDRLPVLADALEEAGCTNPKMLEHCRAAHLHETICWVVELLLGPDRKRR